MMVRNLAAAALAFAACAMLGVGATADDRDGTLIVFGGLGYYDGDTNPKLADFLFFNAQGADLEHGGDLLDSAYAAVTALNARGGLPTLSSHPVILDNTMAQDAIRARTGTAPPGLIERAMLEESFDRVYALVLLGSYEDVVSIDTPYDDLDTGERRASKLNVYIAGMNAMLVEVATKRIANAAPALENVPQRGLRPENDTLATRAEGLTEAYQRVINSAVAALAQQAADLDVDDLARPTRQSLVTDFTISQPFARSVFGYTGNPTAADLQADACALPPACSADGGSCRQVGGLLMQGVTTAMSQAGRSVVPPISSDYLPQAVSEVQVHLSMLGGRESYLGVDPLLRIDPASAPVKVIAKLTGVLVETHETKSAHVLENRYSAVIQYYEVETGADGCTPVQDFRSTSFEGVSCVAEQYPVSHGAPAGDAERGLLTLAVLHRLSQLPEEMRNGRASRTTSCHTF